MGKHAPLTSRFQDIQNRIDDAMFAMNTFGHAGGGSGCREKPKKKGVSH